MEKFYISVIIPAHNSEKTIEQCIESILKQTGVDFEVIVVDNNSTDRTKKIIKKFCQIDARIKYVFESQQGRGAARNAGLAVAKGEIVAMTDSDCVAPDDWLKTLTYPIIFENEKAVMGGDKEIFSNFWTKNTQKKYDENRKAKTLSNGKYVEEIDTKNFAVKTEEAKKVMFDPNLMCRIDVDFYMRAKDRFKVRFLEDLKIYHYHRSSPLKLFKREFENGFYTAKIYKKNRCEKSLLRTTVFNSLSFSSYLKFPIWIVFRFFKKRPSEAFYILVNEVAWRSGALLGLLFSKYPHS